MKTAIIIQARMGSNRLPGKTLKQICGKSVLAHIIERLRHSQSVDKIIVATSTSEIDDPIIDVCSKIGVKYFRGSEDDVLARVYFGAKETDADVIVRVTGDCPLIDPIVLDKIVNEFKENEGYDYVSNIHPPTYPDGLDVEVFSITALESAYNNAKHQSEREHVTPFIWKNKDLFKLNNVQHDIDLSRYRWTLDTQDDLLFITKIYENLYEDGELFTMEDILTLLNDIPEILKINNKSIRNEGYQKSLESDEQGVE